MNIVRIEHVTIITQVRKGEGEGEEGKEGEGEGEGEEGKEGEGEGEGEEGWWCNP